MSDSTEEPFLPLILRDTLERIRNEIDSRACRLFAIACCGRIWNHLTVDLRAALEVAEKLAEGHLDDETRSTTYAAIVGGCGYVDGDSTPTDRFSEFARTAVLSCLFGDHDYRPIPTYAVTCAIAAAEAVQQVVLAHVELTGGSSDQSLRAAEDEQQWQCQYLCEKFGASPKSTRN